MKKQKFQRGDVCIGDNPFLKDTEVIILYSFDDLMDSKPMIDKPLNVLDCNTMKWGKTNDIDYIVKNNDQLIEYAVLMINFKNKTIDCQSWMYESWLKKIYEVPEETIKETFNNDKWKNYAGKYKKFPQKIV